MAKETLRVDKAASVEELLAYLNEIVATYDEHHPSTIYVNVAQGYGAKLYLEEEALSDGSTVINLEIRQA